MDRETLLLEYLKENYAQARQHETRQTETTTFLTAAGGVLLGLGVKDGNVQHLAVWTGVGVFLLGAANFYLNRAYFIGNRFHTQIAKQVRRDLDAATGGTGATMRTATQIRGEIQKDFVKSPFGKSEEGFSIGWKTYGAIRFIPCIMMAAGIGAILAALI